jgi:hypothetical protein
MWIAGLLAASTMTAAVPAQAAGLLGGVLGGGSSGSSGGTSVGVPGVATVSLNNAPSGTTGNATVLNGGGSTLNVGLSGLIGGNSNLGVTLPGVGGGTDNLLGNATDTLNGVTDNGGTVNTLLTSSGLSGDNGGLGGAIGGNGGLLGGDLGGGLLGGGDDGTGNGGAGGGLGDGVGRGVGGVGGQSFLALAGNNAACQRDVRGIAPFFQAKYSRQSFSSWSHAAGVQVVPVRVCPQIKGALSRAAASNASIGMMRGVAAADPLISASLNRTRHGVDDVLGVAQQNGMLTVYVY